MSQLTQILILRRLGLTLNEIRQVLARPESTLAETIRRQIRHLKERIALESEVVQALAGAEAAALERHPQGARETS